MSILHSTMQFAIRQLAQSEFPTSLTRISQSPAQLFSVGTLPSKNDTLLSVVGTRSMTTYGKLSLERLLTPLSHIPNLWIVSGLALGTDGYAHELALKLNIKTLAVPGSGLSPKVLYPRSHTRLAERIVECGGGLLSEYAPDEKATSWSFPARNRIMAALSNAVLISEATVKSGTLITARLALEYGTEVLAIPGSITSPLSEGPHSLIKSGARMCTSSDDILEVLGLQSHSQNSLSIPLANLSPDEALIYNALAHPRTREELLSDCSLTLSTLQITLSLLELRGLIVENLGFICRK